MTVSESSKLENATAWRATRAEAGGAGLGLACRHDLSGRLPPTIFAGPKRPASHALVTERGAPE